MHQPVIAIWQETFEIEDINLIYQNGDYISFDQYAGMGNTDIIQPVSDLEDGLYCLQYQTAPQESESYYWCFKVSKIGGNE